MGDEPHEGDTLPRSCEDGVEVHPLRVPRHHHCRAQRSCDCIFRHTHPTLARSILTLQWLTFFWQLLLPASHNVFSPRRLTRSRAQCGYQHRSRKSPFPSLLYLTTDTPGTQGTTRETLEDPLRTSSFTFGSERLPSSIENWQSRCSLPVLRLCRLLRGSSEPCSILLPFCRSVLVLRYGHCYGYLLNGHWHGCRQQEKTHE